MKGKLKLEEASGKESENKFVIQEKKKKKKTIKNPTKTNH